jgi:hypothetical protein
MPSGNTASPGVRRLFIPAQNRRGSVYLLQGKLTVRPLPDNVPVFVWLNEISTSVGKA